MSTVHGFTLVREEAVGELRSTARLYRHEKTGAQVLSLINDDENKAFAITFRTPPTDSTGIAHIMEHSVLCGSRKYPLKEPFVELIKGSLKTFLNAFTGSAETYYPVASLNKADFYNLVDVYLDAVLHPRITPETLQQEGWHYELTDKSEPIIYKGVVFNEMKGSYSSPDTILYDQAERALFPDHIYGVSSGGEPPKIPDLTYEQFKAFHENYYHPSNAMVWFWGDDPEDGRLEILDRYFSEFDQRQVDSIVPLAPHFSAPKRLTVPYPVSPDSDGSEKGRMAMSWVLTDDVDIEFDTAAEILRHSLVGTSAAPLRKALIDSRLVEDVSGGVSDIRQRVLRIGLKGVRPDDADKVQALVLETLERLAKDGIDPEQIRASLNTIEFGVRELNTGSFPQGLMVMFWSLSSWLYGGDPVEGLHYERTLASVKEKIAAGGYFENLIRTLLLDNPHRATIVLIPDAGLSEREAEEERAKLAAVKASMTDADLDQVIEATRRLQEMQQKPDSEEALATIPRLSVADLSPTIKTAPTEILPGPAPIYYHDIFTNGIVYADLAFDLSVLPQRLLPYLTVFGRSLLQTGTATEDFVRLTQRIGSKTGGIRTDSMLSSRRGTKHPLARFVLRGKATPDQAADLTAILRDVLLTARLDNRERIQQIVLEERVRLESSLVPSGHSYVANRLGGRFTEAGWISDQTSGISYLFFIRDLIGRIEADWASVQQDLESIRDTLLTRAGVVANVTLDQERFARFRPDLESVIAALPDRTPAAATWAHSADRTPEGMTLPGKVNYVGKGGRLYDLGFKEHGSSIVVSKYLRASWLWEKVRVEGGAYGGFCSFDSLTGLFSYLSYRDPNLIRTLTTYDESGPFLQRLDLSDAELTRAIIGAISDLDSHQLPDARGYSAFARTLIGETDEIRQRRRDEVLGTTQKDFRAFGDILVELAGKADVVVMGSPEAIEKANTERPGWLRVTKVL